MSASTFLGLPFLEPAQAQKHVTVNDAFRRLDAVVNISVLARNLATPPDTPAEGDRYIVASGASGAWLGRDAQLAALLDGAWEFFQPQIGWMVYVRADGARYQFDGQAWVAETAGFATFLKSGAGGSVGVNATADTTNRLSVRSSAVLFDTETGDSRVKVNKSSTAATASHLFQDNYSARAEFGLIGNDNVSLKVSPNGSTWTVSLTVNATTGKTTLTKLNLSSLPTSATGLSAGDVWKNGNVLNIV